MEKFSAVLERGGLGYNFEVSADVTMKNEQKFRLSMVVNALNEKKALDEAQKILVDNEYIVQVSNLYPPNQLN